jgi:hypothetical protein
MNLAFVCAFSGVEIVTSIATDADTLSRMINMKVSVWCPKCHEAHQIAASIAYLIPSCPHPTAVEG